jgi:hypothetical protein
LRLDAVAREPADSLEQSELESLPEGTAPLAERLRAMEWPKPPEGARERCLEEIMGRVRKAEGDSPQQA